MSLHRCSGGLSAPTSLIVRASKCLWCPAWKQIRSSSAPDHLVKILPVKAGCAMNKFTSCQEHPGTLNMKWIERSPALCVKPLSSNFLVDAAESSCQHNSSKICALCAETGWANLGYDYDIFLPLTAGCTLNAHASPPCPGSHSSKDNGAQQIPEENQGVNSQALSQRLVGFWAGSPLIEPITGRSTQSQPEAVEGGDSGSQLLYKSGLQGYKHVKEHSSQGSFKESISGVMSRLPTQRSCSRHEEAKVCGLCCSWAFKNRMAEPRCCHKYQRSSLCKYLMIFPNYVKKVSVTSIYTKQVLL